MIGLGLNIAGNIITAQRGARLIPTLAGSQYGTIDTVITFTGDFEIESKIAMTNGATGTFQIVTGASTTADYQGVSATGVLTAKIDGSTLSSAPVTVTPFDGKIHTWILSRVGSVGTLTIDGVVQFTGAVGATDSVWEMFGANILPTAVNLFQGQILSIKFTDAGTVVANFVFDSGSTTDQPSRGGGNNVSLVNFATTDWNRYTQQRNILHDAGVITEAWIGDTEVPDGITASGRTIIDGTTITWQPSTGYDYIRFTSGLVYLVSGNVTSIPSGNLLWNTGSGTTLMTNSLGAFTHLADIGLAAADIIGSPNGSGEPDIVAENVSVRKLLEVA